MEERLRKASDLRARLLDVPNNLGRHAEPSTRQLLHLIEETIAMNVPMTPEQFAELKDKLQRQVRDLRDEDFAALSQKRDALSRQEHQRLTEQHRKMVPHTAGDGTSQS